MTIDSSKKGVVIPAWIIQSFISVLITAFIIWGAVASARSDLNRAKQDIEVLRQEKVSKDVFDQVMDKLNKIEQKLDQKVDK